MVFMLVGAEGFEPPTLCSQSRCATRLRYAPTFLFSIVSRIGFDSNQRRRFSLKNTSLRDIASAGNLQTEVAAVTWIFFKENLPFHSVKKAVSFRENLKPSSFC
jgi:hypothetical protein